MVVRQMRLQRISAVEHIVAARTRNLLALGRAGGLRMVCGRLVVVQGSLRDADKRTAGATKALDGHVLRASGDKERGVVQQRSVEIRRIGQHTVVADGCACNVCIGRGDWRRSTGQWFVLEFNWFRLDLVAGGGSASHPVELRSWLLMAMVRRLAVCVDGYLD